MCFQGSSCVVRGGQVLLSVASLPLVACSMSMLSKNSTMAQYYIHSPFVELLRQQGEGEVTAQ
jgi:hypothetical protein